ncbi:MAG: hypothetical protein LBP76_12460 [Treponema sp.]|jgi:hypothetical protein|nr:hypothetical protein [Treponema sp.]
MILLPEKKWPCLILAAYLALVIVGMYTLLEVQAHYFDDFTENGLDNFFTIRDYTIDCQAEDSRVISKAGGYSSSPLGNGSQRITALSGMYHAGITFFHSAFKTIINIDYSNIKNNILLKLRI